MHELRGAARAVVRGAAAAPLAVRPADRRGLQARADPEARSLARRAPASRCCIRTIRTSSRSQAMRRSRRGCRCSISTTMRARWRRSSSRTWSSHEQGTALGRRSARRAARGARSRSPRSRRSPTLEATGRVLARAQRSTMDVPPMDNSAMDGYAVRASEVTAPETRLRVAQKHHGGRGRQAARSPAPRRASSPARRSRRAPTRS